jgi:hypothetical protein
VRGRSLIIMLVILVAGRARSGEQLVAGADRSVHALGLRCSGATGGARDHSCSGLGPKSDRRVCPRANWSQRD